MKDLLQPETGAGYLQSPEFLNKDQVASLLGVSRRTVDQLLARGELPVVRLSKRCIRFPRQGVIESMNRRVVGNK